MEKSRLLQNYWLRAILKLLAVEIILIILVGVLHQFVGSFQRFYLSDIFFMLGSLLLGIGAVGNFARPYSGSSDARVGNQSYHVQATEQEQRSQMLEEAFKQRSISLSFVIIGLLNILLAAVLTYI